MDRLIAEHVVRTRYAALDDATIAAAKQHVLHTLATIIGGSAAPGIGAVLDLATEESGRAESRALVHGTRLSAMNAALVNAATAHALDFDMNDDRTYYKSSVIVVPAALALAERNAPISGREFLTAVCVGIDLGIRIGLAVYPKPSHVLSQMVGGFGGVASAARLLHLDEAQFLDALGISYCQVSASGLSTASPSLTKRLTPGLAARAAVFSALLSEKGFTGGRHVLQGPSGYFRRYHGTEGDHREIVSDLGRRWELANVGPKAYPCCRVLHAPIDAALAVVRAHDIRPEQIEKVVVRGSRSDIFIMEDPFTEEGIERRRHPQGVVDAQFSIHWAVAAALVRRDVFIDCFTEDAIRDPDINALTPRIDVIASHKMERPEILLAPASVEVRTTTGEVLSAVAEYATGNPRNPVSFAQTQDVLRQSAACGAKRLAREQVEAAIGMVEALEDLDDMRRLTEALCSDEAPPLHE